MIKEIKKKNLLYIIAFFAAVFLFYYSYRYILKYNADGTSPTYKDTPMVISFIKYVLISVLLVFLFVVAMFKKINIKYKFVLIVSAVIILQNVYSFLYNKSVENLIFIICMMPFIIILLYNPNLDDKALNNVFKAFMYFTIGYEFLQLFLYFVVGRLPALAYPTGNLLDVRFGGAWDDPNGFGLLLAFYFPYVWNEYSGYKRYILIGILLLMLVLTWSLTAFGILAAVYSIYYVYRFVKVDHFKLRSIIPIFVVIGVIALGIVSLASGKIREIIEVKSESVFQHFDSYNLKGISPLTMLGLKPNDMFTEAGVVRLILHGGFPLLIMFYALGIMSVVRLYKIMKFNEANGKSNSVVKAFFYYNICFLLFCTNFSFMFSFSCMGIYCIGLCVAFSNENTLENVEISD